MQIALDGYQSIPAQQTSWGKNILDKDDFLKLLITELRYQDALEPMNDRDFIAQMAQMSALEQMQNLNNTVEEGLAAVLETQQSGQANMFALGELLLGLGSLKQGLELLGREVTYLENGIEKSGSVSALTQKDGYYVAVIEGQEVELTQIKTIK